MPVMPSGRVLLQTLARLRSNPPPRTILLDGASGRHASLAQGVPPVLNRDGQAVDRRVERLPQHQCCVSLPLSAGNP